jgi:flagellar L-ring protein precursor FlgH
MKFLQKARRDGGSGVFLILMVMLVASNGLPAQMKFLKRDAKPSQAQSSLDDYLTRVRALAVQEPRTTGSLWSPSSPMSTTASDYKARHTGDLLVIRVVDKFSATNDGSAAGQRTFSASSGVKSFFGTIPAASRWQSLFSPTSTQNLNGKGQSALSSTLSLNLAGRVVEALSNGVLVVEAVRDLTVGNDRQTIVLRGLVRPGDIASDGSVLSSSIGNLEAEIHGKGIVADAIHQPNIIVRTLLKILGF